MTPDSFTYCKYSNMTPKLTLVPPFRTVGNYLCNSQSILKRLKSRIECNTIKRTTTKPQTRCTRKGMMLRPIR